MFQKKEWETKADNRPINSQSTCFHSKLQTGNSEKGQECYLSQRLDIFVGPDRCIFACPDSTSVTQMSSVHSEWQGKPFQSPTIRSFNKSVHFQAPYDGHCHTSKEKGDNYAAISRRLVISEHESSNSVGTHTLHNVSYNIPRPDYQLREINYEKSDLIPAQIFTFIGMEFLTYSTIVRVPHPRVQKLLETIMIIYQKTFISARVFRSLLGQLSAAGDFIMLGRLHL